MATNNDNDFVRSAYCLCDHLLFNYEFIATLGRLGRSGTDSWCRISEAHVHAWRQTAIDAKGSRLIRTVSRDCADCARIHGTLVCHTPTYPCSGFALLGLAVSQVRRTTHTAPEPTRTTHNVHFGCLFLIHLTYTSCVFPILRNVSVVVKAACLGFLFA